MSWHLRHLNPALLNRQGMSTNPKMENGSELCHWKGQLIIGLCVDPVWPCKPLQIGAKPLQSQWHRATVLPLGAREGACKDQAEKGVRIDGYALISQPYMLSGQGHYIPPLVCRSWDISHLTDSNRPCTRRGPDRRGSFPHVESIQGRQQPLAPQGWQQPLATLSEKRNGLALNRTWFLRAGGQHQAVS